MKAEVLGNKLVCKHNVLRDLKYDLNDYLLETTQKKNELIGERWYSLNKLKSKNVALGLIGIITSS